MNAIANDQRSANVTNASETGTSLAIVHAPTFAQRVEVGHVEAFARAFVELGSWGAAYRKTFDVSGCKDRTLWNRAYEFAQRQDVRDAIAKLFDDARRHAIIKVNDLLAHLADIARANPSTITWVTVHACRHCHGIGGAYQWRDYDEWAVAAAQVFDSAVRNDATTAAKVRIPMDEGGFGYTMHRAPNPECESCAGAGLRVPHVADRDKLGAAELKLIKGVKAKADGSIEVLMHDQLKAAELVGRILGAFNDKVALVPPPKVMELPAGTTAEQVAAAYLSLVTG